MLLRVPCGCGLGERHSNAFVTQERGNCKSFLHNCVFVPLPGGYQAANKTSTTWTGVWEEVRQHYLEAERGTFSGIFKSQIKKVECNKSEDDAEIDQHSQKQSLLLF